MTPGVPAYPPAAARWLWRGGANLIFSTNREIFGLLPSLDSEISPVQALTALHSISGTVALADREYPVLLAHAEDGVLASRGSPPAERTEHSRIYGPGAMGGGRAGSNGRARLLSLDSSPSLS